MKYPWQLYHWHLELSAKCTLKCPRCPRIEHPDTPWMNNDISLDDFTRAFPKDFIKKNVERFTLCGDIGDPIYAKDFLPIVRYIKEIKPTCHIFTITNGSYKKTEWWEELAGILNEYDSINFSIDGFDNESNNLYRVNSNFKSILNGVHIMGHQSKAFINWCPIYFSFNQDKQDEIRELAKNSNCDQIQWTKSTKFGSKYGEAYQGENDDLEPRIEYMSSSNRYERSVEKLSTRSIPNDTYLDLNRKKYIEYKDQELGGNILPLCLVGNRGMYISADGVVHPCSWTSFPYTSLSDGDKTIKYQDSFFFNNRKNISIKHNKLLDILDNSIWDTLFNSWKNPDKTWVECNLKCNKKYVDYEYAVGYETN
jgi:MoaA/NifB/PqqE/SkfB family radical SAM enzyme